MYAMSEMQIAIHMSTDHICSNMSILHGSLRKVTHRLTINVLGRLQRLVSVWYVAVLGILSVAYFDGIKAYPGS